MASLASSAAYESIGLQNVQAIQMLTQEYLVNASIILASLAYLTPNWPKDAVLADGESFDFIIAGGGAAGCILAARLTENPNWKVLLIEAGGDPPLAGVLAGTNYLVVQTPYDWNYTSLYPPEHLESKTVPGFTSSGKMLGGSSGNMYMQYIRGSRADYEAWGKIFPEWNYESVLPYFKKLEGLQNDAILNDPVLAPYHNANGPVKVTQLPFPDSYEQKIETYLEMYEELGLNRNPDYNGPEVVGASKEFFSQSQPNPRGYRYGSARAYLLPAATRSNLFVLKNAFATRVVIENQVAKGVEVFVNGETSTFYAKKEVIVSAGVPGSTKLLYASGVGPAAELARLNVDVVADLPVGLNMEDHAAVLIVLAGHSDLKTNLELRQPLLTVDALAVPTVKSHISFSGGNNPDVAITNFYISVTNPFFFGVCTTGLAFNYNINLCKHGVEANLIHELFVGEVLLSHPLSKGRIIVNSFEPDVDPIFDFNYFSDEDGVDQATMREALRYFASLTTTTYLRNQSFVVDFGIPSCGPLDISSDEYMNCYIKNLMHSALTFTGTTAMGKVVDQNMKVYGIQKLRAVDAGSIPVIPSGHTFPAVAMLSEKISDAIKAEYGYTTKTRAATTTTASTTKTLTTKTSATSTSATPTSATPTSATPTSATPTSATPTSATPTSATPTSATPTSATPTSATSTSTTPTSTATTKRARKGLLGTILGIL